MVLWRQGLEYFRRPIIPDIEKKVKVTKACVAFHNFLMKTNNANSNIYYPANYVDTERPSRERRGDWRSEENSLFAAIFTSQKK